MEKIQIFPLFYYLKISQNDRDHIFKEFYSEPRFYDEAMFLRNFKSKKLLIHKGYHTNWKTP